MLLALTAVLSVSMTACNFGGGSDEDSSVVQVTPTPEPTKAAKATPTPAPANAQNTTYTSKNKAVSIKLPDATWANKSDSDDMLSFESPKQGKLLILHGSGEEDMSVAIIPSSQDTASALVKADNLVEGTDFEIQDYKSEEVSGVNVYSYTVHYLTDKSDYKYVVNKYFTDNTTEFYSVAGSVKDEKALAGIKTSVDSFTISGDSVLKAAATGKTSGTTAGTTADGTSGTTGTAAAGTDTTASGSSSDGSSSAGTDGSYSDTSSDGSSDYSSSDYTSDGSSDGSYDYDDGSANGYYADGTPDPQNKNLRNYVYQAHQDALTQSFQLTLNYNKSIKLHEFGALLGFSQEWYDFSDLDGSRKNILLDDIYVLDAGTEDITNGGGKDSWALRSYFGRINYDFAGKYLLEANFRADASSRFAPGHRWGYFPSFSGAWRISEEEFMESTHDWLSSLKIRASWGMLGNQDALNKSNPWENQYYPWMQTYNLDGNYPMGGNLTTGYYQKAYRIEDLSWEKSTTWGIGLDAVINHVTFTFDYYDRKTTDIIMEVPVPTEFGLDPYFDNVGSMRNRGVEVQLGYNNKWNDWSLNVMGNMAYNKNKIEDLGGVDRMTNPDDGDLWRFVGKPIDSYYVYKADGFFQSDAEAQQWMDTYKGKDGYPFGQDFQAGDLRYVDTNGDGKLDADDRVLSKTINPVVTFGLNLNVGYKAFDLTLNFTGAANVGRAFTKEAFGEFSGSAGHPSTAWLDSWTPENTNASMPRVAESRKSPSEASNVMSDFWVINTSYLRLKTLQLGYTLPKSVLNAIGLSNVRVYYSAENLFTIDSMPLNVDPETVSSRLSSYPLVMTNSFGVNVTF